jgi:purine-nucleoside phosphorylase
MPDWRLLGSPEERYVEPSSDLLVGGASAPPVVGTTVYVVFSGSLYEALAERLPEFVENPAWPLARMPMRTFEETSSIHFPLYGSPRAAAAVEQLVYCGAERLVGLGLCGSLASELAIGDLVAPAACVRGDAASYHYLPPEIPALPARPLLEGLVAGLPVREPLQYTTDALYRETHEQIAFWRGHGVETIDMESATFLAVSRALGARACWIGVVSDVLEDGAHHGSIGGESVIPTAAETFAAMIRRDR